MIRFYRHKHEPKTVVKWYNPFSWIRRGWEKLTTVDGCDGHTILTSLSFCGMLLAVWLFHILFIGWVRWLFFPKIWIGRVDQVKEGYIDEEYNRHFCDMAREAILANADTPDALVKIVRRDNPIFMSDGFCTIYSPKFNAKWGWSQDVGGFKVN